MRSPALISAAERAGRARARALMRGRNASPAGAAGAERAERGVAGACRTPVRRQAYALDALSGAFWCNLSSLSRVPAAGRPGECLACSVKPLYAQGLVKCPMASNALVLHYRREPMSANECH